MKLKPVVASLVMLGLMAPAFAKSSVASQQAILDQNSVTSPICSEGWFNRISVGGVASAIGLYGRHSPAGTFTTKGDSSDLYINNLNLLVNANLSNWSKATVNLGYFGTPDISSSISGIKSTKNNVVVDEAYVTLVNLAKSPFYMMVGKKYVPFGDYVDPYTPAQVMSPAQMLAQTNAVSVIAGATSDFGFYANLFAFKGDATPKNSTTGQIRNFGAKVGYSGHLEQFKLPNAHVNFALSYIRNLWDSQVFTGNSKYSSVDVITTKQRDSVDGVSAHADFAYKAFSLYADWVASLKNMLDNEQTEKLVGSKSTKFWGANVNADYAFKTLAHDSHLGFGVQWSGNGNWIADENSTLNGLNLDKLIPKWRLVGEYKVNLFKNTDLGLIVAHGKSYDLLPEGTQAAGNRNTTLGLARLLFQF